MLNQNQVTEDIESFVERMTEELENDSSGITAAMGKSIGLVIYRQSPWQYSDKATFLKIRYFFAKNPNYNCQVPVQVENFLLFLENEDYVYWNEVYMMMFAIEEYAIEEY